MFPCAIKGQTFCYISADLSPVFTLDYYVAQMRRAADNNRALLGCCAREIEMDIGAVNWFSRAPKTSLLCGSSDSIT